MALCTCRPVHMRGWDEFYAIFIVLSEVADGYMPATLPFQHERTKLTVTPSPSRSHSIHRHPFRLSSTSQDRPKLSKRIHRPKLGIQNNKKSVAGNISMSIMHTFHLLSIIKLVPSGHTSTPSIKSQESNAPRTDTPSPSQPHTPYPSRPYPPSPGPPPPDSPSPQSTPHTRSGRHAPWGTPRPGR